MCIRILLFAAVPIETLMLSPCPFSTLKLKNDLYVYVCRHLTLQRHVYRSFVGRIIQLTRLKDKHMGGVKLKASYSFLKRTFALIHILIEWT